VPCALCGRGDALPVLHGSDLRRGLPGRFAVVRCRGCGLAFVNPRPTREGIARYYPPDYAPHRAGPPRRLEALYYRLFRAPPVAPGSRVLDVGCGGGRYLLFLRARGYRVAGVEPNAALARELRERWGLEVSAGGLREAALPAASFDAVTFWWVLEHTHQPLDELREAHRLLRPGGCLVVALQNFASLARRLFGAHWHHIDLPSHLYQFEPRTLARALAETGFLLERLRQDPVAKDFAPSLGHRLGLSLDRALPNLLALPFELLAFALGRSGLMTARARRA
jgi:SAM-dependent methyltransferase